MRIFDTNQANTPDIVKLLKSGKVGIIPTDTLYGFVCNAFDQKAVNRIFETKHNDPSWPYIVLINEIIDILKFGIELTNEQYLFLRKYWPDRVTVELEGCSPACQYLLKGSQNMAFRVPIYPWLLNVLHTTGPLVTTAVNLPDNDPINNFEEINQKFGNVVDFGVKTGPLSSLPSTLVNLRKDGSYEILREGYVKITDNK